MDTVRQTTTTTTTRQARRRPWKRTASIWSVWLALGLICCSGLVAAQQSARLPDIIEMVDEGHFADAEAMIARSLDDTALPAATRTALEFERERMRRILIDFHREEADVRRSLGERIPDLRDEEFARWKQANQLEHRVIDGRTWYFDRAVSNLFRLSPEANARRPDPSFSEGPMESPNAHQASVRETALASGDTSVGSHRIRVTQTLTVDADAVPAGETVRAWIPYPRAIPGQQEAIRLVDTSPDGAEVAPESVLQRTAYLEQPAVAGEPTEFAITYELDILARYFDIDADRVTPAPATAELASYLGERAPHIVFTPELREFSSKVVGDETNPYLIARKLFAAVDEIPWAGAREYSTISNISDYALHAGHADCGQQTLLLITLLRLNGIPARWQSGMVFEGGAAPDHDYWNLHDWGWVYLAPYGWVPMDVTTGRFEGNAELEWFYLGGLDAYRIVFNDGWGSQFQPAKIHFRSETVDSQRGEVEWSGGNLYFDQWDYGFEAREVEPVRLSDSSAANHSTRPSTRSTITPPEGT